MLFKALKVWRLKLFCTCNITATSSVIATFTDLWLVSGTGISLQAFHKAEGPFLLLKGLATEENRSSMVLPLPSESVSYEYKSW